MQLERERERERDYYLDFVKGILVISVVLIHTAFCSGTSYVPSFMREIVLALDVPLFFFITGCVISKHPNISPLKQLFKFILLFFLGVLLIQICLLHISLPKLMKTIFLISADTPKVISVKWSYWFVPMYVIALLYSKTIIQYFKKWFSYFLLAGIPIFYIVTWIINKTVTLNCLGLPVQSFLFYIWLILFGYEVYKFKQKKFWIFIAIGALITTICFYSFVPDLVMQKCKFPVKLPYFALSLISISATMFFARNVKSNFISKIGENAIYYYFSQGIGASIIFNIAKLPIEIWQLKFILCFSINLLITIILGYIFSLIYPKFEKLFIK